MKYIARFIFRLLARIVLRRYRPLVVAISGSVGKTATKEAIAAAIVSPQRSVRKTEGNFNAETGVPVTITSGGGPPTSLFAWIHRLGRGLAQVFGGRYPRALVLELGADHPGDLQPLLNLVHPSIAVLTSVGPEHLEYFGDEASVIAEESLLVRSLPPSATAVVNVDDPRIRDLLPQIKAKVITFGWSTNAIIRAESASITKDDRVLPDGMIIKISLDGSVIPVALPGVIGRHQAYPLLAAVAVGRILGDETVAITQRLSGYQPPPGRMRLFHGRDGALLIDDSYNASPEAMQAALTSLQELETPNAKIAILGQMSELGATAADWHDRLGREVARARLDRLVTVGPLAQRIGAAAAAAGMPADRVQNVPNAEAAAAAVLPLLTPGVAVLIKGSRYAARLERAVAILLDNPDHDRPFLVHSD